MVKETLHMVGIGILGRLWTSFYQSKIPIGVVDQFDPLVKLTRPDIL